MIALMNSALHTGSTRDGVRAAFDDTRDQKRTVWFLVRWYGVCVVGLSLPATNQHRRR